MQFLPWSLKCVTCICRKIECSWRLTFHRYFTDSTVSSELRGNIPSEPFPPGCFPSLFSTSCVREMWSTMMATISLFCVCECEWEGRSRQWVDGMNVWTTIMFDWLWVALSAGYMCWVLPSFLCLSGFLCAHLLSIAELYSQSTRSLMVLEAAIH